MNCHPHLAIPEKEGMTRTVRGLGEANDVPGIVHSVRGTRRATERAEISEAETEVSLCARQRSEKDEKQCDDADVAARVHGRIAFLGLWRIWNQR